MQQSYTNYSSVTRTKYWLLLKALYWWRLFACHYEKHYLLRILATLSLNPMQSATWLGADMGCNLHRKDSSLRTQKYKNRNNYYLIFIKQSNTMFYIFFSICKHLQIIVIPPTPICFWYVSALYLITHNLVVIPVLMICSLYNIVLCPILEFSNFIV